MHPILLGVEAAVKESLTLFTANEIVREVKKQSFKMSAASVIDLMVIHGHNKIGVVKEIREKSGMGLLDAKEFVIRKIKEYAVDFGGTPDELMQDELNPPLE